MQDLSSDWTRDLVNAYERLKANTDAVARNELIEDEAETQADDLYEVIYNELMTLLGIDMDQAVELVGTNSPQHVIDKVNAQIVWDNDYVDMLAQENAWENRFMVESIW